MSDWDPLEFLRRGGYEPGPVPDWLQGPLNAVLGDLQRPKPVEIEIRYSPHPQVDEWGSIFVIEVGQKYGLVGIPVTIETSRPELMVEIADGLQEQVFPEMSGSWGEARPECPGHSHPAEPEVIDDEAWWVCPRSRKRIRPIGSSGD